MPAEQPERESAQQLRVGVISDTHGWLDPRAMRALEREAPLSAIVHAGDIGDPSIIWELETLAPVTAVLGNCDAPLPGLELGGIARLTVAGVRILVVHDFADLGPIPEDVDVVVRGHSHIPGAQWHGRVLVVNPGSATQRRRQPSCTVGVLRVGGDRAPDLGVIELDELGPRWRT